MSSKKKFKILLRIETSRCSGRQFIRGILRYTRLKDNWEVESEPIGIEKAISRPRNIKTDGLITRVWDKEAAQRIIKENPNTIFFPANKLFSEYYCVYTDHAQISKIAAKYLLERGLKNFAFCGYKNNYWSKLRGDAFRDYLAEQGYETKSFVTDHSFKNISYWDVQKKSKLIQWLKKLPKPIGIFACNDEFGSHVIGCCRVEGLKIPSSIAVIGVDNDDMFCEMAYPQLTSIDLATEQSGYAAAHVLDRLLHGEKVEQKTILTDVVGIVERQSTNQIYIENESVSEAIKFIKENVKEPLQVTDVADHVSISRRELLRKFQSYLGVTVHEVIQNERVNAIQKCLLESKQTIAAIAYEFGFSGPEKLSRFFKRVKGVSPKQFKSRH